MVPLVEQEKLTKIMSSVGRDELLVEIRAGEGLSQHKSAFQATRFCFVGNSKFEICNCRKHRQFCKTHFKFYHG